MNYYTLRIYGIVQGVGFRPFISRLMGSAGFSGSVKNCGSFVEIHVAMDSSHWSGEVEQIIRINAPARSDIADIEAEPLSKKEFEALLESDEPEKGECGKDFFIARSPESEPQDAPVFIPADIAICDDCARELYDRTNRRYLHPFINCTQCGPRLTIIKSLPYDRSRTSMSSFPMCASCQAEYTDPGNRRYDAQPVCCNDCGPEVYFLSDGRRVSENGDAITMARQYLIDGKIVAVKGIGGFHLYCNAASSSAVKRLRERKCRPAKPFAIMCRDMDTVKGICEVKGTAEKLLTGFRKPIVLLEKKGCADEAVCEETAPCNPRLGVMLPYAPIQLLLFSYPDGLDDAMPAILVATSANRSGGVICRTEEEVVSKLGNVCDGVLSHNREILTRADDSVVDLYKDRVYMIRRSRGYSPGAIINSGHGSAPFDRDSDVLAFGGELKNTFCVGKNGIMYPSSYIGDLADPASGEALMETADKFLQMLDADPSVVVCDSHPGYRSHAIAKEFSDTHPGCRLVQVQHHYAHALSVMAENHYYDEAVAVVFDGTGYGDDGTIWGGEILLCDTVEYHRFASIAPFVFSGGDAASREGFRVALSMIFDKYDSPDDICDIIETTGLCDKKYVKPLHAMHDTRINSVDSTSCGRLFDAVSAILGIKLKQSFEGEAAQASEYAALRYLKSTGKQLNEIEIPESFSLRYDSKKNLTILPTDELFYDILDRRLAGEDVDELAFYFHQGLAQITTDAVIRAVHSSGSSTVVLSGGCFQNTLLLGLVDSALSEHGCHVLTAGEVPPNDGGISLGQCLYGMGH